MNVHRELSKKLREKFEVELQKKTGWGRNEVLQAFDAACVELFAELLDTRQPKEMVETGN